MTQRDPHAPHASSPTELHAFNAMKRTGKPFIAWRDGEGGLHFQELSSAVARVTIGRAETSTITLDWDPEVSSLHAEVTPIDAEWLIADDGLSINGTFIGGERVGSRQRLRDEDRIMVGTSILVFHGGDVGRSETLVAGGTVVQRTDLSQNELHVLQCLCTPLLQEGDEPSTNETIAEQACLTVNGVKRCLTRLYEKFQITEDPKRRRLARRAIATGVVRRSDHRKHSPTSSA